MSIFGQVVSQAHHNGQRYAAAGAKKKPHNRFKKITHSSLLS